jgi:hypothetical protein
MGFEVIYGRPDVVFGRDIRHPADGCSVWWRTRAVRWAARLLARGATAKVGAGHVL